uniref:Vitamin D-binding protein n=1 Tax=Chelydra serpentina TaxID=8475 RepID=A0A8C3XVY8_CHESE
MLLTWGRELEGHGWQIICFHLSHRPALTCLRLAASSAPCTTAPQILPFPSTAEMHQIHCQKTLCHHKGRILTLSYTTTSTLSYILQSSDLKQSSALSAKSCDENAPYPDHPGIAACCTQQGLEQKLCLAALHQPPKEFPTYVEPLNDELCEAFKKDPQDFADRFTHEYSSNYGQAPLPVLVGSIKSYLSMVGTCCISPSPTVCFLKERLERKTLSILTTMSNRICSRYTVYGKEKSKFSTLIKFAQKIPSASFEDISPLAEDSHEVFSKCCNSMAEDCMQKELSELTTKICTKLSSKNDKFSDCCKGKNLLENYLCMYSLPPAKSPQLPEIQRPTDEQLCTADESHQSDRFIFETARRQTNIPEVFLSKVYDAAHKLANGCCTSADSVACVSSKRPQLRGEIVKFLAKAKELCGEYNDLTFLEFKQRLKESFSKTMPDATPASLTELVEQRANFASTCCIMNAPPMYCGVKINTEVGHTCDHDSCMLI